MWPRQATNLFSRLNITVPVIQAPMAGGATTPALVAAVSNAGGLGSIGAGYLAPADLRAAIRATRELTQNNFNVNLFTLASPQTSPSKIAFMNQQLERYRKDLNMQARSPAVNYVDLFKEQFAIVIEEKVPVFSFTFGTPSVEEIELLKKYEIVIIGTATTVREGLILQDLGCDIIVGQGSEAGGHRGTFASMFKSAMIGTMALIPQLVDQINLPVVAAGGIMDGRGLAASLALGASGVQMGTAFLTTKECGIHERYKRAILGSNEESTVITSAFSGKPARGIKNKFIEEMEPHQDSSPDYPIQNTLTQDIRKEAAKQNRPEYMSLWAGQGTRLSKEKAAAELLQSIVDEARKVLNGYAPKQNGNPI